jgi:FKBP-type peptidyl-prolyl cis-trans isomerase
MDQFKKYLSLRPYLFLNSRLGNSDNYSSRQLILFKANKILLFLIYLILLALPLISEGQKNTKTVHLSAPQSLVLTSKSDSLQYALGAFLGNWLLSNEFSIDNPIFFNKGMDDVLKKQPLSIPDSLIAPYISSFQLSLQNERSRQQEQQLFDALKGKAGVGVMPNGVHYMVVNSGTGPRPLASDTVVFNTIGMLPDGTVFEDTYKKNQAIRITPASLIPGLAEAMQIMPEGSVWRVFIPSLLGYGARGIPNVIPPYSALVFEVRLDEVIKKQ